MFWFILQIIFKSFIMQIVVIFCKYSICFTDHLQIKIMPVFGLTGVFMKLNNFLFIFLQFFYQNKPVLCYTESNVDCYCKIIKISSKYYLVGQDSCCYKMLCISLCSKYHKNISAITEEADYPTANSSGEVKQSWSNRKKSCFITTLMMWINSWSTSDVFKF